MHESVKAFFLRNMLASEFTGGCVLEVGSYNVNGGLREIVERLEPFDYVGTDMRDGPGVDYVIEASRLAKAFPASSFKAVICTEMLEHCQHWREAIDAMKRLLQPGGVIYVTTRSKGFPLHEYPGDFWRFSKYDLHAIFRDFDIVVLEDDPQDPGVFLKATKPVDGWEPVDLSDIELYQVSEADAA